MFKKMYATLEEIPEDLRKYYVVGQDKKYHLNLEGDAEDELRLALDKERKERVALNEAIAKYKDIDPEKARKALADLAALEEKKAEEAGNFQQLKTQMAEKHATELGERDSRIKERDGIIEGLVVDNTAIHAITEAKGKVKVLLPHLKRFTRVKVVDGKPVAVVVDEKGNERIADGKGTPMTIAQLVEEMKADPDFGANFESDGKGGSGARAQEHQQARGGGAGRVSKSDQGALNSNLEAIAKGTVTVE